jgi:YegS/Rv2252/BmrU family lipid kinase
MMVTQPGALGRPGRSGGVALVVNPSKAKDLGALTAALDRRCDEFGLPAPAVLRTSTGDPGQGQARQALRDGAGLVLAAGGDGTVRAVAETLAGTGVALGILPLGTGNLLARNLGLPLAFREAIDAALCGTDRALDVGRLDDGTLFLIMAGAGWDAAMLQETPESLKSRIGWPAYVVGGLRSARGSLVEVELRLDDRPPLRLPARTVLVGNVGRLQGGLDLLPDAQPDDGLLDVVVIQPRRTAQWVALGGQMLSGQAMAEHRRRTFRARRVAVRLDRPQPRQVDGDLISPAEQFVATVDARSLIVRVARVRPQ